MSKEVISIKSNSLKKEKPFLENKAAVFTSDFISGLRQAEKDFDAGKTRKIKSLRDLAK